VDFADVRTIMKDRGLAIMGTARALGPDRALEATLCAISSPLLENMNMKGSQSVLLNITGSKNLSLHEISQAASVIYEQADPDAQIILGSVIDESMGDEVQVTIIATGFESAQEKEEIKVKATVLDTAAVCEMPQEKKPEHLEEKKPIASVLSHLKKSPEAARPRELLLGDESLDVPAFMRKSEKSELENS
jgi:cell division GTPase FtsZ